MKKIILLLTLLTSFATAEKPSIETIKELCNTTEAWSILDIKQINQSSDDCWLAVIYAVSDRGACCSPIVVLVDSKNNRAKEVKEFELTYKVQCYDVNQDGISEIILTEGFGRGGYNTRTMKLVQVTDFTIKTLHTADAYDAQGTCNEEVEEKYVTWAIKDLDGDGIDELLETVTLSTCISDDDCEYTCSDNIKSKTYNFSSFSNFSER